MNKEETVDLALLYAMGILSAEESARVDRLLAAGDLLLESEIRSFREIAAQTSLALPESSPSPSIKARLMAKIRPAEVNPPEMTVLRGGTGEWCESGIPGIQFQLLHHDEEADLVTQLVRMAAGTVYPAHYHKKDEQCYVLQGSILLDRALLGAGDFSIAHATSDHRHISTATGCTLLIINCPHDELIL
jgi:anti-sigma factor ChrR (cupin superfamily)